MIRLNPANVEIREFCDFPSLDSGYKSIRKFLEAGKSLKEKHLYNFGHFSLCAEENVLRRDGKPVALTPKMFEMLLVLVQNHGRIVEKKFLMQSVWPDSFVEEGNISFNIRQLRKALGDSAQTPKYIETVPRRGYRFVADVVALTADEVCPKGEEETNYQPANVVERGRDRHLVAMMGLLFAIVAAFAIGVWFLRGGVAKGVPILSAPLESEKLSTDGQVFHAAITSDGKTVVYSHRNGGKQSLWLRELDTSNNIPIIPPSDYFYYGLALSPDDKVVYFSRGTKPVGEGQIEIFRVSIFGGVPQKLLSGTQGWISLSPDGNTISFVRCPYETDEYCSLWVADSLDGKNERKILTRSRPIRIGDNKFSPDGKKIAFAAGQSRTASNEFGLFEVDVDTGAERELTQEKFFNINYLAWLPNKYGLLATARKLPDRNYRIWQISNSAGEAAMLTADSETYARLGLNADASLLISTQIQPDFHLNIYQTEHPDVSPRVLGNASTVAFAPNGRIVFSSIMTGDQEIWGVNPDGSDQRQLTSDPADDIAPIVSPDNNFIFFTSSRSGQSHVWRMNSDGSNQVQVTTQEGGQPMLVSPDGKWVYYFSGLHSTLRRVSTSNGEEQVVLDGVKRNFTVSPDGSRAVYSEKKDGESVLTLVSFPDSNVIRTFRAAEPEANVTRIAWSMDGKYLAYILTDMASDSNRLWFQSLNGEQPRQIADLRNEEIAEIGSLAISPDGKAFAVIKGIWKHDAVLFRGLKK